MATIIPYQQQHKSRLIDILQGNTPEYFDPSEEPLFIDYLDSEREDYFVVEQDGQIIGSGGLNYEHGTSTVVISWDLIDAKFQGRGLGRQLLAYRLHFATSLYPSYTVRVRTSQKTYLFYEKNGFELKDIRKDYWASGYDLYDMSLVKP